MHMLSIAFTAAFFSSVSLLAGCADEPTEETLKPSAFALRFMASENGNEVGCTDTVGGLGTDGKQSVGLSDLRFYVSNIRFVNEQGNQVLVTLDENDFQYTSADGSVALVDLTSNTEGTCSGSAVAFAEGTARTNSVVTGTTLVEDVASIAFDVGVPQAIMKQTIANNTAEGAPSPLNEMYWSWASGYRHFVMNFTVDNGIGDKGDGYLHIGSRDCGPKDGLALEDRGSCGFVNTPTVSLKDFDLKTNVVLVELPMALEKLDFVSPIYDMTTFEVIGEGPGVECHSSPMQPDCPPILSSFGLDPSTGVADVSANKVFAKR